ncbi:helix-turn-helix transcriptional regulator [Methanospirillum lacunae]|uniref:ArsR family transcriptional regulator n=1 Tax=Methanospirillum lacunae TaxID=668570 RepID=A0A2V2NF49_9EURY|nr:transcriptional regulator FilR1 domain-containing protein [Methanospirillum lacunae]PWR73943.1 ArsR family transcriptional regulator [Methanospirillum lacunae]
MTSPVVLYNDIRCGLDSILRSRLQMQILLSLGEGCKTLSDLRAITGSSSQALVPKIRELETRFIISSKKYEYCLTPLGRLIQEKLTDFTRLLSVLFKHDDFWNSHYLDGIPPEFIKEISDLYDSRIIADTNIEVFQVYSYYLKILEESDNIHWISSILNPHHIQAITSRLAYGIHVEMIVNSEIAEMIKTEPYCSLLGSIDPSSHFKLYLTEERIKIGMIVSDTNLFLGLFKNDMITFDASSHFISVDPDALSWGERLFSYYKDRSSGLCFQKSCNKTIST